MGSTDPAPLPPLDDSDAGAPAPPPVAPPPPGVDRLPAWVSPPVFVPVWLLGPPADGPGTESADWPLPLGELVWARAGGATRASRSRKAAANARCIRPLTGMLPAADPPACPGH